MDRYRKWIVLGIAIAAMPALLGSSCNGGQKMQLVIESPAHGSFSTGASVLVTGRVVNVGAHLASLTVNGTPVTVEPDRTWSTSVPLDAGAVFNPLLVELTNISNGIEIRQRLVVIAGPSVADGDLSLDSVALRLNDTGLDQLEPEITSLVDLDLGTLLPVGTFITSISLLWNFNIYVDSPAPSYSGFDIDIDSQVQVVDGFIDLNNLRVDLFLDGTGFLAPDCGARVTSNLLEIDGQYALDPDAADSSRVDVSQVGPVSFGNTVFDFEITSGFWCEVAEFLGIIGDLNQEIEGGLSGFLNATDANGNTPVAGAVEEALAGIEITGPIGEGLGVTLEAPLFTVDEDTQGITLGNDSSFQAEVGTGPGQCDAPEEAPDLAASLDSTDPFPAFALCTGGTNDGTPCLDDAPCTGGGTCQSLTPGGLPYGLAIASSRAAFNQLLKAQTECGLLTLVGDDAIRELVGGVPLDANFLKSLVPEFELFPPTTPFRIELVPTLAPLITGNPGPLGELAELRIAQLGLEIIQDDGSEHLPLAGTFDARVGLEMVFDDVTGSLSFQLGNADPDDITIVITTNLLGTNADILENNVLPYVLAYALPSLASDLGEFPLPSFLDLELEGVEVERQGDFLSIFADLVPGP